MFWNEAYFWVGVFTLIGCFGTQLIDLYWEN